MNATRASYNIEGKVSHAFVIFQLLYVFRSKCACRHGLSKVANAQCSVSDRKTVFAVQAVTNSICKWIVSRCVA